MNLAKALGTVGGLTLASRVLGLVRDSLFARYVGAGFASDAFLVAFRLPNMFRALFAEGASRVVAIGADSPTLPPGRLRAADAALFRANFATYESGVSAEVKAAGPAA